MTACISKDLRIKEKNEKMIHDRWQSNRDRYLLVYCFILALMEFAMQVDSPVACPR
jgi:hypothetical protein